MSIVARRGRIVAEPRTRLLRYDRPTVAAVGAIDIFRDGGSFGDVEGARLELDRLALDLVVRTSEPISVVRGWTTTAFGREVDRTRAQLAPIRTRDALAISFSREAAVAATRRRTPAARVGRGAVSRMQGPTAGPVRLAYAIRWLELGDGRARPAWAAWIGGPESELQAMSVGGAAIATPMSAAAQRNGEITT